jgi:hypothetical protein
VINPNNVCSVLEKETAFSTLTEELRQQILGVIPEFLQSVEFFFQTTVDQGMFFRLKTEFGLMCIMKGFLPFSQETELRMSATMHDVAESEIRTSGKHLAFTPEETDEVIRVDSKEIRVPRIIPEELRLIVADYKEAMYRGVEGLPLARSAVQKMYPTVLEKYLKGLLTVSTLLEEQPSLIFMNEW